MSIESRRQDREDSVMGALDLATKPIQAAKSALQFFAFGVILLAVAIGTPIYLYFSGQPASSLQLKLAGTALLFVFTLIYDWRYTLIGGFLAFIIFYCSVPFLSSSGLLPYNNSNVEPTPSKLGNVVYGQNYYGEDCRSWEDCVDWAASPEYVTLYYRAPAEQNPQPNQVGLSGEFWLTDTSDAPSFAPQPNILYSITMPKGQAKEAHEGQHTYRFFRQSFPPSQIHEALPLPPPSNPSILSRLSTNEKPFNSFMLKLVNGFLLLGIAQRFLRQVIRWQSTPPHPPRRKLDTAERLALVQVYGSFEATPEWVPIESAEEIEAKQIEKEKAERERAEILLENKEILARISELLSSCGAQATEMMRAARALKGTDVVEPKTQVLHDVAAILVAFRDTDSSGKGYVDRLWLGLDAQYLSPTEVNPLSSAYHFADNGDKPLRMVLLLKMYDIRQRTNLASQAASTYLSIVSAVFNHCGDSLAAKIVADAFIEMLRPYINESGGDRQAGRPTSSSGSQSHGRPVCQNCVKDYQLLGLPVGAPEDQVKQKKRDLADVLHPDHLGSKSERVRDAAEQQLKSINAACDRILSCRRCAPSTA